MGDKLKNTPLRRIDVCSHLLTGLNFENVMQLQLSV